MFIGEKMEKFLAGSIITIFYLTPLASFAQRRSTEQTKAGKMTATYTYDAVNEFVETKSASSSGKSADGHYTTKVYAQFESSQLVKAKQHDGFVSIIEPLAPQGSGTYSYMHTGEEHLVSSDDLHHDSTEESSFKGTVTEAGAIEMEFPDSGENVQSAGATVSGTGAGAYKETSRSEEWTYNPATVKNEKKMTSATDNGCQVGHNVGQLELQMLSDEPDSAKPPESGCGMKFSIGDNIATRKPTDEEIQSGTVSSGASFNGSFAAGQYKVSLTVTNKPVEQNTEVDGGKNTFTETKVFTVTLTLAGKTAELFAPDQTSDFGFLADALLPEDKLRFYFVSKAFSNSILRKS